MVPRRRYLPASIASKRPAPALNPFDDAELHTVGEWTKQLITIATGALVVTTSLLPDVLLPVAGDALGLRLLGVAEIAWAISAVFGVFVFGQLVRMLSKHRSLGRRIRFAKDLSLRLTAGAQVMLFAVGLVAFAVYAARRMSAPPGILDDEATPPTQPPAEVFLEETFSLSIAVSMEGPSSTLENRCPSPPPSALLEFHSDGDGRFVLGSATSPTGLIMSVEFSNLLNVDNDPPPRILDLDPSEVTADYTNGVYRLLLLHPQKEIRFRADALIDTSPFGISASLYDNCGNTTSVDPYSSR